MDFHQEVTANSVIFSLEFSDLSSEQKLRAKKFESCEAIRDIGEMHEMKIKNEEVSFKEDLEQSEMRSQAEDVHSREKVAPVKNENYGSINKVEIIDEINSDEWTIKNENIVIKSEVVNQNDGEWKIKSEEIDIKEEELTQNETSVPRNCIKHGREEDYIKHPTKPKPQSDKQHFPQKKSLKVNQFKCDQCYYKTIRKSNFKTHLREHKVETFKCDQYDYKTIHKDYLKAHLLHHQSPEEDDMLKCACCEFRTTQKRYLKVHLLRHRNREEVYTYKFKCDQCDYQTIRKTDLKRHVLRHKNLEECDILQCYQCSFQTVHKQSLKTHVLRHKKPEEIFKFKCGQCGYQTSNKQYLKRHCLLHRIPKKDEMLKCHQCNYKTFHKEYFKKHILRHK